MTNKPKTLLELLQRDFPAINWTPSWISSYHDPACNYREVVHIPRNKNGKHFVAFEDADTGTWTGEGATLEEAWANLMEQIG